MAGSIKKIGNQTKTGATQRVKTKASTPKAKAPASAPNVRKDSVSLGNHNPHQAQFDLQDQLEKWASGRSKGWSGHLEVKGPGGEIQGPKPPQSPGPGAGGSVDVPQGNAHASTPKTRRPVDEGALYMLEVRKHMDKSAAAGGNVTQSLEQPRKFSSGRAADPKPITVENPAGNNINRTSKPKKGFPAESLPSKAGNPKNFDVPKRSGPSFLERFQNSRLLAAVGLANSANIARDGVNDIANGNYLEGGLKVTGGTLDTYNNASDLYTAHQAAKTYKASQQTGVRLAEETVEQGLKGAKVAGKLAGGLMAAYDGKQAYDAFAAGDEVKGTEHAMDTAWDVASFSGVGTAGAVAHSLTRLAMSQKFNGVSGDDIVTGKLDSLMNSGANAKAAQQSSHDQKALNAFRGLGEGVNLHAAACNKEDFAHAITGLLDQIGKTEDAGQKRRLQAELQEMRQIQRRVREYNRV